MSEELSFQSNGVDRLPPQIIEAEEAILGGILLDPEAISRISDRLKTEAFYISAHKEIYQATLNLHRQGKPTDLLTVTSWLSDHDLLARVGGRNKLASLVESTVSAVNIDALANLVIDKYQRRQLIKAGNEIVQLGFETETDINKVVDEAEQKVFNIAASRSTSGLVHISDSLISNFKDIENRNQGIALPGISSGFYDLDAMINGGFQRSDLVIIAGRPAMGKTSFAINVAHYIAGSMRMPVAIFSLEMSKEQLALRMLSSEARIESTYLRSGRISQNQWEDLMRGISSLQEMPIYIGDSPGITVTEMRSQARRLQAEAGADLGLILIDYLQLMEGGGDNRVQELSKITRSIKGLARELNVPVIALSQLSRGVESRTNKRPMLADLRESGCLTGDSLVTLADTGMQVPIRELTGKSGFTVWALNETTLKLEKAIVSNAFCTGVKSVFRLTTRLGRTIRATGNHKFLTIEGWCRLDELEPSSRIALPRHVPSSSLQQSITNAKIALLGHLINDRCTLPKHTIQFHVWKIYAVPAMQLYGITTRQMQAQLGNAYCGTTLYKQNISRDRAARLANAVQSNDLARLSVSDVYWDEIISIEPDGETEVYDLTVPDLHNFVANGIIAHNSIEQDADLVMMLYRDEYYSPDTPERGLAEVIVAKHRHGPTGTIKLLFDPQFTQFKNLARGSY
jgi:replicative DNA helicase